MKKLLIFAALSTMLVGCSDNDITEPQVPSNPGSEITFSIKLSDDPQSRTIYGKETDNAFPIYWVDKDQIIVASPQCQAGRNNAVYQVTVDDNTSSTATAVNKVGEAGVQWGNLLPASFYSVYPTGFKTASSEVKNSIVNQTENAVAHLNVRNFQINVFEKDGNVWRGKPMDLSGVTNPDALMYAQTKQGTEGDVILQYSPFTVAFNITLQGYQMSTTLGNPDKSITIEEVMISAPAGTQLAGNFDAEFNANCKDMPTVNTEGINTLEEPNVIHIPMMSTSVTGNYLTIAENESVNFNVFAIPTNGEVTEAWTLTVRTTNGTYTRPLTPNTAEGKNGKLIAGQMHKLDMPKFTVTTNFMFNKAYWITQIPRNVYLSELSLPGAWYCYNNKYQATVDLAEQWKAGVRAFHIDCRLSNNNGAGDDKALSEMVLACAGSETWTGTFGNRKLSSKITVLEELQKINEFVKQQTSEYAVVVLTIAEKPVTFNSLGNIPYTYGTNDQTKVLQAIAGILNTTNLSNLYTDKITPATTIKKVLGKLIVKINTTDAGPYDGTVPSTLLSKASLASNATYGVMQNSTMYWGAENSSTDLTYNYIQAQRTYTTGSNSPQMTSRQSAIESIINKSDSVYTNSTHNAWFQMGIGGYVKNSDTDTEDRVTVAQTLNNYLLQRVNAKSNGTELNGTKYSPSPVGIVLANFITVNTQEGTTVYGTDLIEGIIKMNRMFRLDRDPTQEEWPDNTGGGGNTDATDASVTPVDDTHASGYKVDANNWSVF